MKNNLNINEIQALLVEEVKAYSLEKLSIKGFDVYLIDLGKYFGYSALVFKDAHHIYHANLYELFYKYDNPTHGQLRERYINILNNKLFLDEELISVDNYHDYNRKTFFIRNYMSQEYDYLTAFCINGKYSEKDLEKFKSGKYPNYSNIAFAYFKDNSYQDRAKPLINKLEKSYSDVMENIHIFKEAVKQALYNHEVCITYEFDAALSSMGLVFEELPNSKQAAVLEMFKEVTSERGRRK